MIQISDAIVSLVPSCAFTIDPDGQITWLVPDTAPVTDEQIQAELARLEALAPLNACKEKAKQLLAQTDWAVLPDVGLANQDAFVFYRLNLRNLVKNPVSDAVFEDVPQAIWS